MDIRLHIGLWGEHLPVLGHYPVGAYRPTTISLSYTCAYLSSGRARLSFTGSILYRLVIEV